MTATFLARPTAAAATVGVLIAILVAALLAMGHPPICTCGTVKLWHGVVTSPENSQHLTDWYTFSHVIHGFAFYGLLHLLAPRMPIAQRFLIAVGLEVAWEIVENTPLLMDRYRQTALAQGYFGDSVVNSVADTLAAALGFALARWLPVWLSVVLIVAAEIGVAWAIRDNLALNVIQLLFASDAVSRWQSGG